MSSVETPGVTQLRVARSEWTKLCSLRSTRWSLLAAALLTIGFPLIFASVVEAHWGRMSPSEQANRQPLDIALVGVNISQLAVGVLGVLLITAEYSTGMIRATLSAVPKRLPVLWAKIAVYAALTFGLALLSVLVAFFGSQAILNSKHILQIGLGDPDVIRSVLGAAAFLVLIGIFAMALGAIVRNTAGGIATFALILFVIPPLLNVLPPTWNQAISTYLPDSAGRAMFALSHGANELSPAGGLAVFAGTTACLVGIAALLLVRRDS